MQQAFFWVLFIIIFFCNSVVYADIIRLKRGVSFEGEVIEETNDKYVFEMGIGVVEFLKDDVEGIEHYNKVENLKMQKDWENDFLESRNVLDAPKKGDVDVSEYQEDSLLNVDVDRTAMVRYKGRYITPEVYDIIQKERDIKERRYKFLKQKREKEEARQRIQQKKDTILKGVINVSDDVVSTSSSVDYGSGSEGFSDNSRVKRFSNNDSEVFANNDSQQTI